MPKTPNKSWRTYRHKLFDFFLASLQPRRWAHINRSAKMGRIIVNKVFAGAACCLLVVGCMPGFTRSEPTAVVAPAPNRPYLILTADRSILRHGESVEFAALFINPTDKKIMLPTESASESGIDSIEHRLEVDWKGENGSSSGGISAIGINVDPPRFSYLQPRTSRSYRLRWKFEGRGKGTATLTYHFGWSDVFPPVKIILQTR